MPASKDKREIVRVAALADIHYAKSSQGSMAALFAEISDRADVMLVCGDLTDYGLVEEAQILIKDLNSNVKIPILAVLGNHDYEGGKAGAIRQVLLDSGVTVLDGESCEVHGVGFARVKGFAGGFGQHVLTPWGESQVKEFVNEAVEQWTEAIDQADP